jgi:hypothetical protein
VMFALEACPALHQWVHPDAQTQTHNCLVTQMQKQSVLAGAAPVVAPVPPVAGLAIARRTVFQFAPACGHRLSPSRAPPPTTPSGTVAG